MFIAASSTITKLGKQLKCPSIDEWIKRMWGVCVSVCVCVYGEREREAYNSAIVDGHSCRS